MSDLSVIPSRYWQLKIDNLKQSDDVDSINYNEFITGKGFTQRRIVFNILQDFQGSISYADIKIFGLNSDTINKYLVKNAAIQFDCGYQTTPIDKKGNNQKTIDNYSTIFTGKIKNAFKSGLPPETFLQIFAISETSQKNINLTLGKPAKVLDVISACASAMGYIYKIDSVDDITWEDYKNGFSAIGNPKDILNKIAFDKKFRWIIENNIIVITPIISYRDKSIEEINWKTGMVGIPQINESGIDVIVNLKKRLKIGTKIKIKSEIESFNFGSLYYENIPASAGNGEVIIQRINFIGDNYGDRWDQQITGFFEGV